MNDTVYFDAKAELISDSAARRCRSMMLSLKFTLRANPPRS